MDRSLCERQLRQLRRKVEEELGSIAASDDDVQVETVVTPGGTVSERRTEKSAKERTKESKMSRSSSKGGLSSSSVKAALKGVDTEGLTSLVA